MCHFSLLLKLKKERDGKFMRYDSASLSESVIKVDIGLWARFLQILGLPL